MILYGNYRSPFVRHCRIALLESGLECDFVDDVDYKTSEKMSPMQRVPFLQYEVGGKTGQLTDSHSIIRYIRERQGLDFLPGVEDLNDFCGVNTLMDTQVNLFLLKKEGLTPDRVPYLQRQQNRIQTGLHDFENRQWSLQGPWNDVELRLGCFLAWVRFRQHFSLEAYPNLLNLLAGLDEYAFFRETEPVESQ